MQNFQFPWAVLPCFPYLYPSFRFFSKLQSIEVLPLRVNSSRIPAQERVSALLSLTYLKYRLRFDLRNGPLQIGRRDLGLLEPLVEGTVIQLLLVRNRV